MKKKRVIIDSDFTAVLGRSNFHKIENIVVNVVVFCSNLKGVDHGWNSQMRYLFVNFNLQKICFKAGLHLCNSTGISLYAISLLRDCPNSVCPDAKSPCRLV